MTEVDQHRSGEEIRAAKRARKNEVWKLRYATDPAFRERVKEYARRSMAKRADVTSEANKRWHRENRERTNARHRAWREANPERHKATRVARELANREQYREYQRRYNLAKNYGLTVEGYDALLAAQGGACAICGEPETATRRGKLLPLHVDHVHGSIVVRGLLCRNCNTALGIVAEDPARLRRMADYIEEHAY